MQKICIFAGTTEGKNLINYLADKPCQIIACTATEYGEAIIENQKDQIDVKSGRMTSEQMEQFFLQQSFDIVVDTTHPFAQLVTDNIKQACKNTDIFYLRIDREISSVKGFEDIQKVIEYLNSKTGNILFTTGSKDLLQYAKIKDFDNRAYARVLPMQSSIEKCLQAGVKSSHIIAMQGPFSQDMNEAFIKEYNIKYLVTKNSGKEGGFEQKLSAVERTGIECLAINPAAAGSGYIYNEAIEILNKKIGITQKQKITVIGIGTGNKLHMTQQAQEILKNCDAIVGAKRVIESCAEFQKPCYNAFSSQEIDKIATTNPNYKNIAVVMSGDIGFYSGAKKLYAELNGYDINTVCGISTPIYFAAALKMPWQDIKMISLHARQTNIIHYIKTNKRVFSLLGGDTNANKLCQILCEYGFCDLQLYVGENLGYQEEKITIGTPKDLKDRHFCDLSAVIIENNNYDNQNFLGNIGIEDTEFYRIDKVPMTKAEVRAVCVSKLKLKNNSIIYDIGAGTGSVSVECALQAFDGVVYAIEKHPSAVEAIGKNKYKFALQNLNIIEGTAPKVLENLPKPTHAFIGGSGGNLEYIFKILLEKNPDIKIVINTIALESLANVLKTIETFAIDDVEISNLNVSKSKKIGKYNMMTAQNPIYIISCQKKVK